MLGQSQTKTEKIQALKNSGIIIKRLKLIRGVSKSYIMQIPLIQPTRASFMDLMLNFQFKRRQ